MSLRMVNGLIAVASAVFCILCIRHGFKQHWGQKTPASRHLKQMAVAYAFGVVFGLIEITLISLKLITPFHYILLDSILNGIILIIIYHTISNLSIEMIFSCGKAEKKRDLRRKLWFGWVLIVLVYIPRRLSPSVSFQLIYEGVRSVLFIWFNFPMVIWFHRRSQETDDFVARLQMNLIKTAVFIGMWHPFLLFLKDLTKLPIYPSLINVLFVMVLFYLGYVSPKRFSDFLYRWFYPVADSRRLSYLATVQAARDPTDQASLLEAQLRRLGNVLSLPQQQTDLVIEASYLRGLGDLPAEEAEEDWESIPSFSHYESSADYAEALVQPAVGNILRYTSERWDGSGPHQLVGREIPQESRILRLMEFFVGELYMSGDEREALEAVKAQEGMFDPELVAALERMIDENGK